VRAAAAFSWIFGLLAVISIAGFPVAMSLFVLCYLRLRSKENWPVAIGVTAVMVGTLYLFFDQVLNVIWPEGLLGFG